MTSGIIRYFKSYSKPENYEWDDYCAHDKRGVSDMRISSDDRYLVTTGMDGSICIFKINKSETGG